MPEIPTPFMKNTLIIANEIQMEQSYNVVVDWNKCRILSLAELKPKPITENNDASSKNSNPQIKKLIAERGLSEISTAGQL